MKGRSTKGRSTADHADYAAVRKRYDLNVATIHAFKVAHQRLRGRAKFVDALPLMSFLAYVDLWMERYPEWKDDGKCSFRVERIDKTKPFTRDNAKLRDTRRPLPESERKATDAWYPLRVLLKNASRKDHISERLHLIPKFIETHGIKDVAYLLGVTPGALTKLLTKTGV